MGLKCQGGTEQSSASFSLAQSREDQVRQAAQGIAHGAINTSVQSPLPHPAASELEGGLGFFTADRAAALTPFRAPASGEPCSAPQHHPHPPALFTTSQPSGGLLPRKSNCSPGRRAGEPSGRRAGLAMTHALSRWSAAFSKGWLGRKLNLKPGFPRRSPATSKSLPFN